MQEKVAEKGEKVITLRAPKDINDLLEEAEDATGSTRTDLIIEAIRESLPKVVNRLDAERSNRAKDFIEKHGTGRRANSTPESVAKSLVKTAADAVRNASPAPKRK